MKARYDAAVVGLGETGFACARFLAARGRRVAVVDSRREPPRLADIRRELPDVPVGLGGFDPELLGAAAQIVLSPGVDPREPVLAAAAASGVPTVGEIELFAREARAPVVAITGSNGKSTVTTLVGEMARAAGLDAAVGGNLAPSALSLLRDPEPDLYVLELSSFQLETVRSLNAAAATVLNISPDHLDRYATLDEYAAAKRNVFRGDGVMVLNADDGTVATMADSGRRTLRFGVAWNTGNDYGLTERDGAFWLARGEKVLLPVDRIRLPGRCNWSNALAALALAEAAGIPEADALRALQEFRGLPHRIELVAVIDGVAFYNDSKGTNVAAAAAAVEGLDRPSVVIAGGRGKGQDFGPLAGALQDRARGVVLIGEDASAIAAALQGEVPTELARDMDDAVRRAAARARPGDAVLLSPACSSHDMFSDYAARGEAFRLAVEELGDG